MSDTVAISKNKIRKQILARRNSEPAQSQEDRSTYIFRNLVPMINNYETIGIYVAIKSEVRTQKIHNHLLNMGIIPLYPAIRTRGRNQVMVFTQVDNPRDMNYFKHGFPQPRRFVTYPRNAIDALIVPGIAFDHHGYRIGYGKGYYDKYLAKFNGEIIGIGYDFQLIDSIPHESHDIRMHRIVTENRILEILGLTNG